MKLDFKWSRLEALSSLKLFNILKARESVFVVEQQCAYQEADDLDLYSWHLACEIKGELAAYARVIDPECRCKQPSIGRVMVLKKLRHLKIGRSLMDEAILFTTKKFPGMDIKISAQIYLQDFYSSLGFKVMSKPYDDNAIIHVDMIRSSTKH